MRQDISKKKYKKVLIGLVSILVGAFLLLEHLFMWEEFTFFDFLGHEWLGIGLILFGFIYNLAFWRKKDV